MPLITDIQLDSSAHLDKYKVRVRPDGFAAASGGLYAVRFDGSKLERVGQWSSPENGDGSGTVRTAHGVWLFAEQNGQFSPGRPVVGVQT